MALGQAGKFALVVAFPGVLAFILGIFAENKKVSMQAELALADSFWISPVKHAIVYYCHCSREEWSF